MEQVPHIATFCHENYQLGNVTQQYLVPMIIKYLTDINNQVRKTCQASLLLMVEQGLINEAALEKTICPLVIQLTETNQMDDHRTEAVTLMSKLAVLVGKEVTEKLFLKRFAILCLDSSFHVRKVCASSFGEFCAIVGREATEKQLLRRFFSLCNDGVWGVRKACAEVFMPVSCVCSMETRHKDLAPIYMDLLCDQSRWVRMAAFQALGPFISTFAEPSKTGLYYNKSGVLTVDEVPSSIANRTVKSTLASNRLKESSPSNGDAKPCSPDGAASPCNSCDTVVPSDGLVFSSTQNTVCHSGSYCTVIELNSPAHVPSNQSTTDANEILSDSKCSNCDQNDASQLPNQDNSHSPDHSDIVNACSSPTLETESPANLPTNSSSLHEKAEDELNEKEHEACTSDSPSVACNGEISSLTDDLDCMALEDPSETILELTSTQQMCLDEYHVNKVTVNGFDVTTLEAESDETPSSTLQFLNCTNDDDSETGSADEVESPDVSPVSDTDILSADSDVYSSSNESAFNHFQFWRVPLPDVEVDDIEIEPSPVKTKGIFLNQGRRPGSNYWALRQPLKTDSEETSHNEIQFSNLFTPPSNEFDYVQTVHVRSKCYETTLNEKELESGKSVVPNGPDERKGIRNSQKSLELQGEFLKEWVNWEREPSPTSQNLISAHDQDIVPPELLLRYLSMTDASRIQSVDTEIARHCAYSFPAVALTLGRRFWPCLKATYNTLASDMQGFIMQWKVRRTLASSMHQLAMILGPDIAAQDLLPIFSGFIRDLDEVRIGILQHLSEFLEVLRPKERKDYLPRLMEFLNTDNDRNWRFRQIFAEQLISVTDLYDPADVREYLLPLSLTLVKDKVSEVRLVAVRVMAVMVRRMGQSPTRDLTKEVLADLTEQFIHAPKWLHRQLYVYLCQEFVRENSLPSDQFGEEIVPHLLYLCWDRVANVRLAIARCLATVIWPNGKFDFLAGTFLDPNNPHYELLLQALHTLQGDTDTDVQYFANMVAPSEWCSQAWQRNSMLDDDVEEPPV